MPPIRQDTALLVFSRSAAQEALAKPLVADNFVSQREAISGNLIRNACAVARHSGLPVFFFSEKKQRGTTFGERFANAFEALYEKGFQKVIAIGNDCPALRAADLQSAAELLKSHGLVLCPASDGGAYLIGMRSEAYDRAAFLHISWQTPLVFEELKEYAEGDFCCLDEKSDVDSPADLARVLRTDTLPIFLKIRLLICLKRLLPARLFQANVVLTVVFVDCRALRGPPRFSV